MKKELMSILVCPVCKGKLELKVFRENGVEVESGNIHCHRCKVNYPITDSIPNLLSPEQRN